MSTRWVRAWLVASVAFGGLAGAGVGRAEAQGKQDASTLPPLPPVLPVPGKPVVAVGASFVEPEGWIKVAPDKPTLKGCFVSPDSPKGRPFKMIMVEIGRPKSAGLRVNAEQLAAGWGGRVLAEPTTLDGVEALRVRVTKRGDGLVPVEGIVAVKDDAMYLLMAGSTPGYKVADQLEEVRRSWKWVDAAPAAAAATAGRPPATRR